MGLNGGLRFHPDADHAKLVSVAMFLLGERRDLHEELCINPKPARARRDHWNVFNFRGARGEFNESPQLLLWVGYEKVDAKVVLPDAAPKRLWTKAGKWGLVFLLKKVLKGMTPAMADCPGMMPHFVLKQRHWTRRGGPSVQDAYLEVDLRTIDGGSGVKKQREWIDVAQDVVKNKRPDTNLELQVGAAFPYEHCEAIQTPAALDHVAAAWLGCRFFIKEFLAVCPQP